MPWLVLFSLSVAEPILFHNFSLRNSVCFFPEREVIEFCLKWFALQMYFFPVLIVPSQVASHTGIVC
jgi:hypothetical protein